MAEENRVIYIYILNKNVSEEEKARLKKRCDALSSQNSFKYVIIFPSSSSSPNKVYV